MLLVVNLVKIPHYYTLDLWIQYINLMFKINLSYYTNKIYMKILFSIIYCISNNIILTAYKDKSIIITDVN